MSDWVEGLVEGWGAVGVAFLMFLENVFPPIPSEIIMPLAGYQASKGEASIWVLILSGTLGAFAGAVGWHLVGRAIEEDRLKRFCARRGRLLTLSPKDIDTADRWFERHGGKAVFVGRLIPTVRTFISVPAGMARMPWSTFLLYTALGTAIWTAALGCAGYALGENFDRVQAWLGPVANVVLAGIVLLYLYRVATFGRRR